MLEERASPRSQAYTSPERFRPRLTVAHLEPVSGWGGAHLGASFVYRPATLDQVRALFQLARDSGRSVGFRGGGNSYGDAAMNDENLLLDLRRMSRILNWDPTSGRIKVEPGVTLRQLFEYVIEDGWWPPICTGTMHITMGGAAAMNVHGKNAFKVGPFGDHVFEFDLMLPSGEIVTCSRQENDDLFYGAIGGCGLLGCFTSITLQMKRIYSGLLDVQTTSLPDLGAIVNYFETRHQDSDYLVSWIDGFAGGRHLGRGDVHRARYLPPGADPYPAQTLRIDRQHLPDTLFGLIPKSMMWMFMRPFVNDWGWREINRAKYWTGRFRGGKRYRQTHVAFHFLLDYVPGWKKSYGRGGLIQYQCFVPAEQAVETLGRLLRLGQERGVPNYLSVLKRHRPDDFLLSHGLEGYSLAMDFRVTGRRRARVLALTREMDALVVAAGGRFYFAKDSTLSPETTKAFLGHDVVARFRALKARCDPDRLLETNLWRRLLAE